MRWEEGDMQWIVLYYELAKAAWSGGQCPCMFANDAYAGNGWGSIK